MKQIVLSALVICLGILFKSCNTTEPPPNGEKPTLELTLEDVSCIEAWIQLKTTNLQLPAEITLKKNNVAQSTILCNGDTLLYIDSLLPNQTYKFQSVILPEESFGQSINQSEIKSNELSVTTMDTTSHSFTFETFTFGGTAGSSTLYDCAIISPENIWCVGEIYVADTSINGYTMYNAVHWNGSDWNLKRILYDRSIWTITTIFAFSENDIWFSAFVRYDGQNFIEMPIPAILMGWRPNKIWGSSSSDLYVVGNNGNIARYNGQSWQRIESGTELNIGDIWGIADGNGGFNKYLVSENALLKLDSYNQLNRINVEPGMFLNSVWGITDKLIYTAGDGVVLYKNYRWEKINRPDVNNIYVIKGQNYNDLYGISAAYTILHFSGYNWTDVNPFPNNTYYSMNVLNNYAAFVGWQGDKAVITLIKRNL
ncbi:MAG: glucosyl transferase [Ignavibacterium sp.]|jgi:hypothetical protein|nr:glucosyl transferase [Ignavibacterium sp.]MDX9711279.1 glucosyl transferase [Ignavibacteriaceae bacterium]